MRPLILFAHGAGAPSSSPWMQAWAERLGLLGRVATFDYPYMQRGSRRPDRLPALVEAHREALRAARGRSRAPVVLAGKSMGSRVGCHLSLEEPVAALVCFGYPLVGQSGAVRDAVLLELRTPILFIQGTRDPLCPLERLAAVRPRMTAKSSLHVVEDGDHSLAVTKSRLRAESLNQDDVDRAILQAIRELLSTGL